MNWFVNRHCTKRPTQDEPPAPSVPRAQEPMVKEKPKSKPQPKTRRSRVKDLLGEDQAAD